MTDAGQPFAQAGVESVVVVVMRGGDGCPIEVDRIGAGGAERLGSANQAFCASLPFGALSYKALVPQSGILKKINRAGSVLGEMLALFTRGIEAGKDCRAIREARAGSRAKPFLRGEDVSRYTARPSGLVFDPSKVPKSLWKDAAIYESGPKILVRRVANTIHATLDEKRHWVLNTLYILLPKDVSLTRYLLGLLNSRLLTYWFVSVFLSDDKLFPYLRISQLSQVPIRVLDPASSADTTSHEQMTALVDRMLDLSARLAKARSVEEKGRIQRLVDRTDREIDALVYELYGLTEEEIGIVEEATK